MINFINSQDVRIDFSNNITNPAGDWNTITNAYLNGYVGDLIDYDTGSGTGIDIQTSGCYSTGVFTNLPADGWNGNADLDWVDYNSVHDYFYSYAGGTTTVTLSNLTEPYYRLEVLSAQNAGETWSDIQAQGNWADIDFNDSGQNGQQWRSRLQGYVNTNWLIWEAIVPDAGQIVITLNANTGYYARLNCIRLVEESPTPVELSTFTAVYDNGASFLEWTTQSESDNMGWNIYRSQTEMSAAILINASLITGAGTTTEPTNYEFYDEEELVVNNTYWYWLESVSFSGETEIYSPISLTIPEPGDNPNIPEIISNISNHPNPFSTSTTISFDLNAEDGKVAEVNIYNMKGQMIRTIPVILNGDKVDVTWDGLDQNGNEVTSGIYTYNIKTGSEKYSGKMILMK